MPCAFLSHQQSWTHGTSHVVFAYAEWKHDFKRTLAGNRAAKDCIHAVCLFQNLSDFKCEVKFSWSLFACFLVCCCVVARCRDERVGCTLSLCIGSEENGKRSEDLFECLVLCQATLLNIFVKTFIFSKETNRLRAAARSPRSIVRQ